MMAVSNSYGIKILKFDDMVGVLLSEEVRRKSMGAAKTSGSALSVEKRRRSMNKEKKKNIKSQSKSERQIQIKGVEC